MSVAIGRLKLRWIADSGIEPLEGVASVPPATQQWMASIKHIFGKVSSRFFGPDAVFNGVLLVVFAVFATYGILHHAMWRDELQAWLVAVDSRSLGELFSNLRLETHPCLWHLLLYCVSRITANPVGMQILHLALAVTTIWMFLRFSPFRRVEKTLFIFGYFPFYEYCLISRDYVLIVLLVFLFCILLQNRPVHYTAIAVVLFCLTNTHLYGFVFALAFFIYLICEYPFRSHSEKRIPQPCWKLATAVSLTVIGFALGLWKCLLVPGSSWRHALTGGRLAQSVTRIYQGYVPLPVQFPYWPHFSWGTNFLYAIVPPVIVPCILAVALGLGAVGLLLDRPKGVFLYGLITIGILMFQFIVYFGPLRHAGMLFIGLIAVFWLSASTFEDRTYSGRLGSICERIPNWRRTFLIVLLAIHFAAGLYAYSAEQTRTFSASRDAAQFLRRQGLAGKPIVASDEGITQGLAAYLQRTLYYPDSSRWGSHAPFRLIPHVPAQKIIQSAYNLFEEKKEVVVMALTFQLNLTSSNETNTPLSVIYLGPNGAVYSGANGIVLSPSEVSELPLPRVKIKKLAQFDNVIADEPYFVYVLETEL